MTDSPTPGEDYHVVEGMKWPNCPLCNSEDTSVVPKTEEWTCGECGNQWHSDELVNDDSDGAEIPGQISDMVVALFQDLGMDGDPRE